MSYFIHKSKAVGIMEKDPTILKEESNYSCMSNPIKHAIVIVDEIQRY